MYRKSTKLNTTDYKNDLEQTLGIYAHIKHWWKFLSRHDLIFNYLKQQKYFKYFSFLTFIDLYC